jgi:hypothetical protein
VKTFVQTTISIVVAMVLLWITVKVGFWIKLPYWFVVLQGIYLAIDFALMISGIRQNGLWWWKK